MFDDCEVTNRVTCYPVLKSFYIPQNFLTHESTESGKKWFFGQSQAVGDQVWDVLYKGSTLHKLVSDQQPILELCLGMVLPPITSKSRGLTARAQY